MGVGAGLVASALSAFLFIKLAGGFTGRAEEIFEGIAMLFGAFLLTTVVGNLLISQFINLPPF